MEGVGDQVVHKQTQRDADVEDVPAREVLDVVREEAYLFGVRQRVELCRDFRLPCRAAGEYFEPLNCTLNDLENIEVAPFLIL